MIFEAVITHYTDLSSFDYTLYKKKLTTTHYININSYSMMKLRIEIPPSGRTLKLGQD